ncbi:YcxB family protein [Pedobacter sp. AW31-3R]|uniref:YcxB family protein n=1 Tax=Pedobacter sp. AW31-3R TaxID=3445781 RepID=UPI003F9FEFDE
MRFALTLTEEDYLTGSLFISSKSKLVKRRRRKTLIILFGAFMLFSISSLLEERPTIKWWEIIIFAFIFIFLYSFYQRWLYQRHYRKNIAETYKNRHGKPGWIEFTEDQLLSADFAGESKINLEQLEYIYEIRRYYLIKFKTAEVLIVPKAEIPEEDFRVIINRIIKKYNVPFTQELEWKFK